MGRARSMIGLIGREIKEAIPIGSRSLSWLRPDAERLAAALLFDHYRILRCTTLH